MTRKNTFFLLLPIILFSLGGCAGLNTPKEVPRIAIKGKKEILILRDMGGGLPFSPPVWCGNKGVLIHGDKFGIEWVGLNGDKVTVSTKDTDRPIGCTPDGNWVMYEDGESTRIYRDKQGRLPDNTVDDGPGWLGFVTDLYRYEIATNVRQKFAVVRDDSAAVVSPDGLKVFLGNKHDSIIEMPEPKWETVWLAKEWSHLDARWLADSSGITTLLVDHGYDVGVEVYGEKGWSKGFSLELREFGSLPWIFRAAADKGDIFSFVARDDYSEQGSSGSWYDFFRCKVKGKDLACTLTDGMKIKDKEGDFMQSFELLPNGDVIHKTTEDNCIRRIKYRSNVVECIADTRYGDDVYLDIYSTGISPNGKRMIIRRGKLPPKRDDRLYLYQYDLFVVTLEND